jgi:hypothetical protein
VGLLPPAPPRSPRDHQGRQAVLSRVAAGVATGSAGSRPAPG